MHVLPDALPQAVPAAGCLFYRRIVAGVILFLLTLVIIKLLKT